MPYDGKNWEKQNEVAKLYYKAIVILKSQGWLQGCYGDKNGPVCLIGAINVAAGREADDDLDEEYYYYQPLQEYLNVSKYGGIPDWNDNGDRTPEEVIDALEGAAKFAETQEMEKINAV